MGIPNRLAYLVKARIVNEQSALHAGFHSLISWQQVFDPVVAHQFPKHLNRPKTTLPTYVEWVLHSCSVDEPVCAHPTPLCDLTPGADLPQNGVAHLKSQAPISRSLLYPV